MSRADDARLIARERVLPGLATLLDGDAFAAALAAALPRAGIEGARATYVRYKPATSCLVAFRVRAQGADHDVYARAHPPDADDKLDSARKRSRQRSALGPAGLVLGGDAIAVHVFPFDRRLASLRRMVDDGRRAKALRRALPGRPELWHARAVSLRHKPERRWVARLEGDDGARALLKLHAPNELSDALTAIAGLSRAGGAPVAPLLGVDARQGMIVLDWLEGRPLDAALADGPPAAAGDLAAAAGAALAALHRADAPALPVRDEDDLAWRLSAALSATAAVAPELTRRAALLSARLAAAHARAALAPVHGDCSADQMVASAGGVRLLDLDAAAHDDPTTDLGAFAADLEARVLRGSLPAAVACAAREALLAGYAGAGGPGATSGPVLARQTAAALLLRAPEPFRARDPEWAARAEAMVQRAEQLCDEAGLSRHAAPGSRARPPAAPGPRATAVTPLPVPRADEPDFRPLAGTTLDGLHRIAPTLEQAAELDVPAGPLVLRRAWPRGPGSMTLELRAPGGNLVAAEWSAGENGAPRRGVRHDAGGRTLVLHPRGADPRLPGLAVALSEPGARLVGHRAGRRAVVRHEGDHIKVVRPKRTAALVDAARRAAAVARHAAFAVPEPLWVDEELGLVRFPTLPGTPLPQLLVGPRAGEAAAAAGAALRALHDAPAPPDTAVHDVEAEIAVIERWTAEFTAHAITRGSPAHTLAGCAAYLAGAVQTRLRRDERTPHVPTHRDLHDKQLLVADDGTVAILDFDTLALGEAALDLANLMVHLELRAVQRGGDPTESQDAARAVLDAYDPDAATLARLDAYADATRLRLACVYAFRPSPDALVPGLLSRLGRPVAPERRRSRPRPEPYAAAHGFAPAAPRS